MTDPLPQVSVVIPVHNRRDYVLTAVRSALEQTHRPMEVVVVDDGSDDGTYEALNAVDAPLTLHRQPINRGQSAARNLGWTTCEGEYVLFLDSDDALEPEGVAALLGPLREREAESRRWGAAYGIKIPCDRNLNPIRGRSTPHPDGDLLPDLLFRNVVRTGAFLVRKSVLWEIGGYPEELRLKEDLYLHLRIAARYRFCFVDRVVARHRRHPGVRARDDARRLLAQGTRHLNLFFQAMEEERPDLMAFQDRVFAREHLHLAKAAWRSGLPSEYLHHWRTAILGNRWLRYHPKYLLRAAAAILRRRR